MAKNVIILLCCPWVVLQTFCQTTFPTNGAPNNNHNIYAFVNAKIYADYETLIKGGTLLIQDQKVIGIGEKIEVPKNAVVIDLKGKWIYPSFIDLYSDYGLAVDKIQKREPGPQMESQVKGPYGWNQAVRSHVESYKLFSHNSEKADELKKIGFGLVLSSNKDGVVRGSGVLVNLNTNVKENESVLIDKAAAFYSFHKGSSPQDYPSSLTGGIALLRQTYYDAAWYYNQKKEFNITLDEFNQLQKLPSIFDANDKFNILRAAQVAKEFNVQYIFKSSGNEYQRINEIQHTLSPLIVPLNFPEPYDVEDPYDAEGISLAELKHWELAPTNPGILEKNNVPFCLTLADLKDKNNFLKNLRKAIQYGLSEKMALKALTYNPALFIKAQDRVGALKQGFYANFFIANKSIFEEDAMVLQHWNNGQASFYGELNPPDIIGNYSLSTNQKSYAVKFSGNLLKPNGQIVVDTAKKSFVYSLVDNLFSFNFLYDSTHIARGSGNYIADQKKFEGRGEWANGESFDFSLKFTSALDTVKKSDSPVKTSDLRLGKVFYPFSAYGQQIPEEQGFFVDSFNKFKNRYNAILIKNVTVWTNESVGVLEQQDVYIVDGKIVRLAPNIDATKLAFAKIIDGKGKHLTPGIIDEHSHIALTGGVNEGAQASSAEVRMGDVINPEDINIYRQLAGGVTTAQLLHGSANPIGGQSVLIKLKWGQAAEDLKYKEAAPFIKFALGENVKQSNWGDLNIVRFPQTRMGVEQMYMDYFTRARNYDNEWKVFSKLSPKEQEKNKNAAPRRDLELEALAEILNKQRFITCHSYVQSEINMLMHVADTFDFKVNTFTHILEGYKVADKMKSHGVNASTFSDWWAYKNEVLDAIPQNAALMTQLGVNTAINSDDAEMARRLNQEAAKSVKYGGMLETEALKLVTLNPAKMLHIEDKVGSIKVGKVADVVLWTDNPLSVYAKVDKTIIDGQIYFDQEEDRLLRQEIKSERARIIAKLMVEKQKGAKTVKPITKQQRLYHCNTVEGIDETLTGLR